MTTLPFHFSQFLSKIEPNGDRLNLATEFPSQVREFLQKTDKILTKDPHSRLAGSYARHVATKDIKDVDIILFLADSYRDEKPEKVLEILFHALTGLPKALGYSGKIIKSERQKRSIKVELSEPGFDLDIVPAYAADGKDGVLEIPDRDWSQWVPSHPLGYGTALSALNAKNQQKVVPLIKILKHWRDVQIEPDKEGRRHPKSFWLECMVYHRINQEAICVRNTSYPELFRDLLQDICKDCSNILSKTDEVPEIPDPMLGNNIVYRWERKDFETFMERIDKSLGWINCALETEDIAGAVKLWQKVFGKEFFPESVELESEERNRLAGLSGRLAVSTTGGVSIFKSNERSIQPPLTQFYGKDK